MTKLYSFTEATIREAAREKRIKNDLEEATDLVATLQIAVAALRAEIAEKTDRLIGYETTMPCGHKGRYAVIADEGTGWCCMCEMDTR